MKKFFIFIAFVPVCLYPSEAGRGRALGHPRYVPPPDYKLTRPEDRIPREIPPEVTRLKQCLAPQIALDPTVPDGCLLSLQSAAQLHMSGHQLCVTTRHESTPRRLHESTSPRRLKERKHVFDLKTGAYIHGPSRTFPDTVLPTKANRRNPDRLVSLTDDGFTTKIAGIQDPLVSTCDRSKGLEWRCSTRRLPNDPQGTLAPSALSSNNLAAFSGGLGKIYIWDIQTGQLVKTIQTRHPYTCFQAHDRAPRPLEHSPSFLQFHPNKPNLLVSTHGNGIHIHELHTNREGILAEHSLAQGIPNARDVLASFDPCSTLLGTKNTHHPNIKVWDTTTAQCIGIIGTLGPDETLPEDAHNILPERTFEGTHPFQWNTHNSQLLVIHRGSILLLNPHDLRANPLVLHTRLGEKLPEFHPTENVIVALETPRNVVSVWDSTTGDQLYSLACVRLGACTLSQVSPHLAIDDDGLIRIIDLSDTSTKRFLNGEPVEGKHMTASQLGFFKELLRRANDTDDFIPITVPMEPSWASDRTLGKAFHGLPEVLKRSLMAARLVMLDPIQRPPAYSEPSGAAALVADPIFNSERRLDSVRSTPEGNEGDPCSEV